MTSFAQRIRPQVDAELRTATSKDASDPQAAFLHLERAHVLGQASTREHVRVHAQMLLWAVRHRDLREGLGQVMRLFGAASKTVFGWVPSGNTGGARVSPFRPMPIPEDLAGIIRRARDSAS